MTVATVGKELRDLSELTAKSFAQVQEQFAQVDARFERVDARFEQLRAEMRSDWTEFAARIEGRFQFLIEQVRTDFKAATDRIIANTEQLQQFKRDHAEEHRTMDARLDDVDAQLQSRGRRRQRRS